MEEVDLLSGSPYVTEASQTYYLIIFKKKIIIIIITRKATRLKGVENDACAGRQVHSL